MTSAYCVEVTTVVWEITVNKFATEYGRRALLDAAEEARKKEMAANLARTTAMSENHVQQQGGRGAGSLASYDERQSFATRDRRDFVDLVCRNASITLAPDPKNTNSVQLGHRVVCRTIETSREFVFRMGGYCENVPNADIPVYDYTKPLYSRILHSQVGDEIVLPGEGACLIIAILPPYDAKAAEEQKAA